MAKIEFAGWTGTGMLHLRLSLVTCPWQSTRRRTRKAAFRVV
jgi:hypothetical protein